MGFAPTWLRQVRSPPPPLHMTTLTTGCLEKTTVKQYGPLLYVQRRP